MVEPWIRHAAKLLEEGKRQCRIRSALHDKPINRITIVFDIAGVPHSLFLWRPFFEVTYFLIRMFEKNYPEFLRKALVFNCEYYHTPVRFQL